jgi:hypothetical protein
VVISNRAESFVRLWFCAGSLLIAVGSAAGVMWNSLPVSVLAWSISIGGFRISKASLDSLMM